MIEDLFCQIYIKFDGKIEALTQLVLNIINGALNQFTIENDIYEIDIIENDEYDDGSSDFLYWKYYFEIEPKPDVNEDIYIYAICKLIRGLKDEGTESIPACDFEDKIQDKL